MTFDKTWLRKGADMKNLSKLLIASALSVGVIHSAVADLTPYKANYYATFDRFSGKNTSVLKKNPETGEYTYVSQTKPSGIAALAGKIKESTRFILNESKVKPIAFAHSSRRDSASIKYDWDNSIAHSKSDEKNREIPLTGSELDLLSLQMQLMQDLSNDSLQAEYTVLKDNALKTYAVTKLAEETITVRKQNYETVKLKQKRAGSSRHTIMWLAKDLQYTVVKMEQYKGDKKRGTLSLTGYKLIEAKEADEVIK